MLENKSKLIVCLNKAGENDRLLQYLCLDNNVVYIMVSVLEFALVSGFVSVLVVSVIC